ncbi:hypothetical protein SAMN04488515_1724 [Cognatiyoonia koreensis]|uniref:Uncharacterized protein n=1 Tax=Cognatiyoonia koreensis TaxID=364200 RepID=A0A1I0Q7C3_9RHOB|nr:hypothetical protein [Cognatiyoonia koreensis]SEW22882.1 hypothetical protein SAMN04488515_1724 [Cognatiyoonia koreensis]
MTAALLRQFMPIDVLNCGDTGSRESPFPDDIFPPSDFPTMPGFDWTTVALCLAALALIAIALRLRASRRNAMWATGGALFCVLAWMAVVAMRIYDPQLVFDYNGQWLLAAGYFGVTFLFAAICLIVALMLFFFRARRVIPIVALTVGLATQAYVTIGWVMFSYQYANCV